MSDTAKYTLIAIGITIPVLIILFFVLMGILFPSEKKPSGNSSGNNSIIFTSSDKDEDLSSNPEYIGLMPDFVSKNIARVENDEDYTESFKFIKEYEYSEEYARETIIAQSIEAGTPLTENGIEVVLTISRGSQFRKMPDLVGKDINYAKDTLYAEFIRYKVETQEGTFGDPDIVLAQSIEPETVIDIAEEHTVILYVCEEEPETSSEVSSEDTDWVNSLN